MITFELAFTSALPPAETPAVYVVIDVLRATSSVVAMLAAGASSIVLVASDASLETARRHLESPLICAENHDGSAAPGADFSPSLQALAAAKLQGRDVILRSANGTVAACALIDRPGILLVGGLLNAGALMQAAVALAPRTGQRIVLVCSGREAGRVPCLDDVYCAGVLINAGRKLLSEGGQDVSLRDTAKIALAVCDQYGAPRPALEASESGGVLRRIGCEADIALAARLDETDVVPVCTAESERGLVRVRRARAAKDGLFEV